MKNTGLIQDVDPREITGLGERGAPTNDDILDKDLSSTIRERMF